MNIIKACFFFFLLFYFHINLLLVVDANIYTVKTFGLLQPNFWSSQLHVCCVRDTLQTSRDASSLVESLSVVETLLLFVKLESSCRKSI